MLRSFAVFSIAVTLGAVFMWVVDALPPRIVRVVPEVASPGEVVRIVGRGFGGEPGKVWVGGRQLLQRNVRSWSGRTVEVELPKDVESGFVVVEARDGSRSNGVLFAVKEEIPVAYEEGASPVLSEVEPARVRIGQLVRLSGGGLSRLREGGRVFVTWAGRAAVQGEASRFLPVPIDQVISWTDEEVVFRMPEGAAGERSFSRGGMSARAGSLWKSTPHRGGGSTVMRSPMPSPSGPRWRECVSNLRVWWWHGFPGSWARIGSGT